MTKLQQKNTLVLLKGASLEKQNEFIKAALNKSGLRDCSISFDPEKLQTHIDNTKTFGKGLIAYLEELDNQLDNLDIETDLKLLIMQRFSEIGSLVFPNTSSCYALVPSDLKKIDWDLLAKSHIKTFKNKNKSEFAKIEVMLTAFTNCKLEKTVSCLISLCLCSVLIQSLKKNQNALLVDNEGKFAEKGADFRPRIKASTWIDKLAHDLQGHLIGLCEIKVTKTTNFESYSRSLAVAVTEQLLENRLLAAYRTVSTQSNDNRYKTPGYFVWCGSNLLVFPKTMALPMLCNPNNWSINDNKGADDGGYLLSSLTNVSYQGYLDSKSHRSHNHHLLLKRINHVNNLQKVKFVVNDSMVNFYNKFKEELTNKEIVLLGDKWLKITPEMHEFFVLKYSFQGASSVGEMVNKKLISMRNTTMKTQEALKIAEFYSNKTIYWPAVQDFRGRIYRIGNLNIQLDSFVRSLVAFQSDATLIKRRKQSRKSLAQYNLLLKEVLVDASLVKKWDAIFGDRGTSKVKFDQLLFDNLIANKLSLIQIGQLQLIRQGAYDNVGVYYDASASAYQIMGVINADQALCEQTNVLKTSKQKNDIYNFFLKELKQNMHQFKVIHKIPSVGEQMNEYLQENFDRKLVKAIVMPLIYGKTSSGFSEDLAEFFKKKNLVTSKAALTALACDIINTLKQNVLFKKVNLFMRALRAIGGFLFEFNDFTIKGYYSDCSISYNKEEIEELRLYYKSKSLTKRYISQKINLSRPVISKDGKFVKSKTKSVNAFVANYVHFLDGTICHYVVENTLQNKSFKIGTIHDSFLISPNEAENLREQYKQGLIFVHKLHVYNMLYWLYQILSVFQKKVKGLDELIGQLEKLLNKDNAFEIDPEYNFKCIPKEGIIKALKLIKIKAEPNHKTRIAERSDR